MARHHGKPLWGFVRLFRLALMMMLSGVAGCHATPPQSAVSPATPVSLGAYKPKRIVSLDFCSDQYVLKLADPRDIVALSPDATRDFSYLRQQAVGIATVRPIAEDVLALRPDLIVRTYGGAANARAFFERAGIKVHQIQWGEDFAAIRTNTRAAARAFGQVAKGEGIIAEFDRRLASMEPAHGVNVLYVTPGGVTSGSGSMVDLMITTAGLTNFQTRTGWSDLPLERLVTQRPDMLATAFFTGKPSDQSGGQDYWSMARHPIVRNMLRDVPTASLDGSTTACAAWFIMDSIEALALKGRQVQAQERVGSSL